MHIAAHDERIARAIEVTLAAFEMVIPDLRLEFAPKTPYLVLSLPLHLSLNSLIGRRSDYYDRLSGSLFLEPQWRPAGGRVRLLAGSRAVARVIKNFSVISDLAALTANDGTGGAFGGGVGLFWPGLEPPLDGVGSAAIYRHTWTGEGQRNDISADLLFFFW